MMQRTCKDGTHYLEEKEVCQCGKYTRKDANKIREITKEDHSRWRHEVNLGSKESFPDWLERNFPTR